ncbi:hypothetical protein KIW84_030660 [Lathyrus oleraceus]|uniref:Uncharacterized protein n=1 Tax=Pisum sativum TaxID=3888 RepID=A0A9D4XPY7_PEA|nr:hypothetical protein KIW84_030660 [Pisum sativum]
MSTIFHRFMLFRPMMTGFTARRIGKLYVLSTNSTLAPSLESVDADNWERLSTPSIGGHKYSLTLVDDYSSDNGSEFLMTSFHLSRGIIHHRSYVEIPQQNGIVERKDQHISNVAHVISFQSH